MSLLILSLAVHRPAKWRTGDIEPDEDTALEELIDRQIVCINLLKSQLMYAAKELVTNQPNSFVEYGAHPSLNEPCQQQRIYR